VAGHGSPGGATKWLLHGAQLPSEPKGQVLAVVPPVGASVRMGANDPIKSY
jgi:hypothetical protein